MAAFNDALGRVAIATAALAKAQYANPHHVDVRVVRLPAPTCFDDFSVTNTSMKFYNEAVGRDSSL